MQFDLSDMQDHGFFPIDIVEEELIVAYAETDSHDEEFIKSDGRIKVGKPVKLYNIEPVHFNRELKLIQNGIYHRFLTNNRSKKIIPRGDILGVISNKGGVGKTTLSIELSYQFTRMGLKTLLVDLDLGNADISNKLRQFPPNTLYDFFSKTHSLEEIISQLPHGFHFAPGESGEFKLANMTWSQKQRFFRQITNTASNFDVVVLDLGAGISRHVIDFALLADESVVVTTPKDFISGYAAGKAAFSRFIEIQSKKMDKDDDHEIEYSPGYILNQINNYKQGIDFFKTIKMTSNDHINMQSKFRFIPEYLGGVLYDREMIDSAYNSQKILGSKYPLSEMSRSILKIANKLLRIENGLKLKKKSSGLKRFARILGLGEED